VKHSAKAKARPGQPSEDSGQHVAAGSAGPSASRAQRLTAQLPYGIVLAGVVASLATIRGGDLAVRGGTLVMAGALLAGALARLVLPESKVGMLSSRRRLVDAAVLATLGVGLLIAGLIAKVPGS
jgi:Protein of unknown function (DUF3017)